MPLGAAGAGAGAALAVADAAGVVAELVGEELVGGVLWLVVVVPAPVVVPVLETVCAVNGVGCGGVNTSEPITHPVETTAAESPTRLTPRDIFMEPLCARETVTLLGVTRHLAGSQATRSPRKKMALGCASTAMSSRGSVG